MQRPLGNLLTLSEEYKRAKKFAYEKRFSFYSLVGN